MPPWNRLRRPTLPPWHKRPIEAGLGIAADKTLRKALDRLAGLQRAIGDELGRKRISVPAPIAAIGAP